MNNSLPVTSTESNAVVIRDNSKGEVEMANNLVILRKVVGYNNDRSLIDAIDGVFSRYGFTDRQKKACEVFLFQPTKETAFKALQLTPKAWVFVKNFLSQGEVTEALVTIVEKEKANSSAYLKVLTGNEFLKDPVDLLLQSPCAAKLEKYLKIREMNQYLKK
ncbi:hypothetical protein PMI08_01075 [Brevibacillus sp. CF112]|uniref:hypothetical protein n=1 Tax=Brevibacillus TaxID=55080 RepID=UPI000271655E|nr:hypothetical protein [Brevibacillus sp. CF112]EJL46580.1 hypothetical protein PMI08_01075 [Brevibacillus sp. CF112]